MIEDKIKSRVRKSSVTIGVLSRLLGESVSTVADEVRKLELAGDVKVSAGAFPAASVVSEIKQKKIPLLWEGVVSLEDEISLPISQVQRVVSVLSGLKKTLCLVDSKGCGPGFVSTEIRSVELLIESLESEIV